MATNRTEMEIATRVLDGGVLAVTPSGELDLVSVGPLAELLHGAHDRDQPVELDLSELSFMDSTGLALLIEVSQSARANGRRLTIRDPSRPVVRIIEMTRTREALGLDGR